MTSLCWSGNKGKAGDFFLSFLVCSYEGIHTKNGRTWFSLVLDFEMPQLWYRLLCNFTQICSTWLPPPDCIWALICRENIQNNLILNNFTHKALIFWRSVLVVPTLRLNWTNKIDGQLWLTWITVPLRKTDILSFLMPKWKSETAKALGINSRALPATGGSFLLICTHRSLLKKGIATEL